MRVGVSEYESTRQRHIESMMGRLPAHVERLGWSAQRLQAERTTRLRQLLAVARERSPWHRDRLAGVDIEGVDEGRMQELPVMSKADLMRHFDAIVTDRRITLDLVEAHIAGLRTDQYLLDELHAVASGGSSGVRGVFVWGWDAWSDCWLVGMRNAMADALSDPSLAVPPVIMAVAAENASHFTGAMTQTFAGLAAQVHRYPVTLPLTNIVAGLNQADGTVLLTYASMLSVLAAEARAGRLTITPRRIVTTAEPLLPEIREAAAQAWNAPVANQWGTSEGGIVALGAILLRSWYPSGDTAEFVYRRNLSVAVGWYWHFLGILWIVLFILLGFWK